jgi:hypothetical protein
MAQCQPVLWGVTTQKAREVTSSERIASPDRFNHVDSMGRDSCGGFCPVVVPHKLHRFVRRVLDNDVLWSGQD